jgi:hypothetical protein
MLAVWRKTLIPHRNRQRKIMQNQKANCLFAILVVPAKLPYPHKEKKLKKQNLPLFIGGAVTQGKLLVDTA